MTPLLRFKAWNGPRWFLCVAVFAALLSSCSSGPIEHYYLLDRAALPGGSPQDAPASVRPAGEPGPAREIRVVLVAIPESIDRPQLVLRRGSNELQVLEFDRWAEPVRSGIARTLEQSLGREFPGAWILPDGRMGGDAVITIAVSIEVMEANANEARLDVRWRLGSGSRSAGVAQHLSLRRATAGAVPAGAVAAWSAELAELATAIARSVRERPADPQ